MDGSDTRNWLENQMFIDNEFVPGSAGSMEHVYPATGQPNGTVTLGGAEEINRAVAAAERGLATWGALAPTERRNLLGRLADIVESWADQFRRLAAAETGIPQRGFDERHKFAVDWIRTYQGWADKIGGDVTASSDAGRFEYTRSEPYGVIGMILTWNSPLLSLTMKIPAALAAGNTVVVKPAELTPYTGMLFAKACREAGIPDGVVNIVPGGIEAGEALILHESVAKISFTGGHRAAAQMMRAGADLIKPFCFELGGKSAHLVFDDADLDRAVRVVVGGLANAGQSCTFGSRVFVHDACYEAFREKLVAAVDAVTLGDPEDPGTMMGPLISRASRDRVAAVIADAVERREATLLCGGDVPDMEGDLSDGFFIRPAVFEDVEPDSALSREEIFGPVFSLFRFNDEADVVRRANATRFGLSNYVHTDDLRRAIRVTAQLKSGTVYVNDASRRNAGAPFGGYGQSGIGYEGGRPGLDEYLRKKTVGLV